MRTITAAIPGGTIKAIPAKAHAHRALMAAALADSASHIRFHRSSRDIDATIDSLCGLGATIERTEDGVRVHPITTPASPGQVRPHESGTTLRLLLPVAAALCRTTEVDAKGRLPQRPLEPLLGQMKAHGVTFSKDAPPFTMTGLLSGGTFSMAGNISSQFFSGLLLAAPLLGETTVISEGPLQSRDYVRLTIRVLQDFGITVNVTGDTFHIPEGSHYHGVKDYAIEGDWSNGAIWLVATALTGQTFTVTGLTADSVQADRRSAAIIEKAGTTLTYTAEGLTATGKATLPLNVDLEQCPDLLPILSILACGIEGQSRFYNGARLRLKESDRLAAMAEMITSLGGSAHIDDDTLYVNGTGRLAGGKAHCYNDHRLVMAGTLAALISDNPVTLSDSEAITKSYPQFFDDWQALGGNSYEL